VQERDKNLMDQLKKLKTEKKDIEEDVRQMVLMMEDRRAELTKQREEYEQALAGQRSVSSQLRDEVAKLTQRQQSCETEIQNCRNDMQRADAARRAQDQEANLSDQRKGHIEAEYEMYLRKEQLRIDFVNESQTMHHNAMDELEKAIAEIHGARNQTLQEKEAIEQEIERCNEAIKKFQVSGPQAYTMFHLVSSSLNSLSHRAIPAQELDKLRRQRADEFRDKRYDMLEKFTELLIAQVSLSPSPLSTAALLSWSCSSTHSIFIYSTPWRQDGMRKLVEDVRQPVSKTVSFYNRRHATTAPAKSFNAFEYSDKNLDKAGVSMRQQQQQQQQFYASHNQLQGIPMHGGMMAPRMQVPMGASMGGYGQNHFPNGESMYRSGGGIMASYTSDQPVYRSSMGTDLRHSFTDRETLA